MRKSRLFYVALAVVALGLALGVDGLLHPTSKQAPFAAFAVDGAFAYGGHTYRSDPLVYPSGVATTGEELVLSDIDAFSLSFNAHFSSLLPHQLHGMVRLQDVFLGDSGWRNVYQLGQATPFSGDVAAAGVTISLSRLTATLARLQAGSATLARAYTLRLQAVVSYQGTIAGQPFRGSFSPFVPFLIDAAVLAPQALGLDRASSREQALQAALNPSQTIELRHSVANVIGFAGIHASALSFRIAGAVLVLLGWLLATRTQTRRRRDIWSNERRVAFRAGRLLVGVVELEQTFSDSIRITVASFDDLVALAVQHDLPVLHDLDADLFGVDVAPHLYLYAKKPSRRPAAPDPRGALEPERSAN